MARMEGLPGFRTLSPAERQKIAAATRERVAPKGATLFRQGQPAENVWAVKDGVVHIVKSGADGREMVLEVIPPGELFGAVAALEGRPYPAMAVAAEDSVVWCVPAALVRDLCQRYPTVRTAMVSQVTERLRAAHERLRSVALERVEQRLARMLLTLAEKIGHREAGDTVVLNVSRQELADMIGTTVETTIRITSKWQKAGVIHSSRNEIGLADPSALREIAEGE